MITRVIWPCRASSTMCVHSATDFPVFFSLPASSARGCKKVVMRIAGPRGSYLSNPLILMILLSFIQRERE